MSGMPPATEASKSRSTPAAAGCVPQLAAVVGEQLFVGADNRLATSQGLQQEVTRRRNAAHDFDYDVYRRVGDDTDGVSGKEKFDAGYVALLGG